MSQIFQRQNIKYMPQAKQNSNLAKCKLILTQGYHITAWNTERDGNGTSYAIGEVIPTTADITVYAQWHWMHLRFQ